jgi:hypothetical protein
VEKPRVRKGNVFKVVFLDQVTGLASGVGGYGVGVGG